MNLPFNINLKWNLMADRITIIECVTDYIQRKKNRDNHIKHDKSNYSLRKTSFSIKYYEICNTDFIIGTNSSISFGDNVRNILFRISS